MTSINQPLSRRSLFAGLGLIVSSATLSGCGASGDTGSSKEKSSSAEKPEVSKISWAAPTAAISLSRSRRTRAILRSMVSR